MHELFTAICGPKDENQKEREAIIIFHELKKAGLKPRLKLRLKQEPEWYHDV